MSGVKNYIERITGELKEMETRARTLKNQNLADILASAHNRVKQLIEHPDLHLVDDEAPAIDGDGQAQAEGQAALTPGDPNANPAPFPQ